MGTDLVTMDTEILSLCEDFWRFQLSESPELSTYTGYHTANDQLDTFTTQAYQNKKVYCERTLLPRVHSIRLNERFVETSFHNQINLDILQYNLETLIKGMEFRSYLAPQTYCHGIEVRFSKFTVPRVPREETQHYVDYICRCRNYKTQVDDYMELMRSGIDEGILQIRDKMEMTVDRLGDLVASEVEDTPFYKPFHQMPSTIPEKKQSELKEEMRVVFKQFMCPALKKFQEFMSQVYIPSCRQELSVCTLPNGDERYAAMLRFHCDVDLSPAEIHQIGRDQVLMLKEKMHQVLKGLNFSGTIQEFRAKMEQDPTLCFQSSKDAIAYMKDVLENTIRPKIAQVFKPAPKYKLDITDDVLSNAPTAAEYYAPTSTRPALLYVTASAVINKPRSFVPTLMMHETEPGHHFQSCYMVGQTDLPKFRRHKDDRTMFDVPGRFPLNHAYTEGWALYCEELGEELGVYSDPYSQFDYLSSRLTRAMRLVVDTGIHMYRWSREEALLYMEENSLLDDTCRPIELTRYATWPGQGCSYSLGHMQISSIRQRATRRLGGAFDIKEFHEVCLSCGQVPLPVLEKIVEEYVDRTLKNST